VQLNSFSPEEKLPDSRTSRLIEAAEETNRFGAFLISVTRIYFHLSLSCSSSILPTDQGLQLWRLFNTPAYNRIKKSQSYLESVATSLVSEKMSFYQESQGSKADTKTKSLFDEYLSNPALDLQDIVGMACDLLLAGVHTVGYFFFQISTTPF
jgi:ecdysteroid 22-hydroxylase